MLDSANGPRTSLTHSGYYNIHGVAGTVNNQNISVSIFVTCFREGQHASLAGSYCAISSRY